MENSRIKKVLLERPYSFYFILFFLAFLAFNIWVNDSYVTLLNLGGLRFWFAFLFVFLLLLISVLFSITLNLFILRIKELGSVSSKESGFAFLGSFFGILGGSCAACIAGVFPAIVAFLGLNFSFRNLPLNGLEISILSSLILIFSIRSLSKDPVCGV